MSMPSVNAGTAGLVTPGGTEVVAAGAGSILPIITSEGDLQGLDEKAFSVALEKAIINIKKPLKHIDIKQDEVVNPVAIQHAVPRIEDLPAAATDSPDPDSGRVQVRREHHVIEDADATPERSEDAIVVSWQHVPAGGSLPVPGNNLPPVHGFRPTIASHGDGWSSAGPVAHGSDDSAAVAAADIAGASPRTLDGMLDTAGEDATDAARRQAPQPPPVPLQTVVPRAGTARPANPVEAEVGTVWQGVERPLAAMLSPVFPGHGEPVTPNAVVTRETGTRTVMPMPANGAVQPVAGLRTIPVEQAATPGTVVTAPVPATPEPAAMVPANDALVGRGVPVPASMLVAAKSVRTSGAMASWAASESPATRTAADMAEGSAAIMTGGKQPDPRHPPTVPMSDPGIAPAFPYPASDTDASTDSPSEPRAMIVPHAGGVAAPVLDGRPYAPLGALPAMEPAKWAEELDARIRWFAARGGGTAEIRLDPPDLGALHVTVHAGRDGATVHFSAPSAPVRELLEHSLPRLRELLENSGMNLVNVNVAQQHDGGAGHRQAFAEARNAGSPAIPSAATVMTTEPLARTSSRLVDAYV